MLSRLLSVPTVSSTWQMDGRHLVGAMVPWRDTLDGWMANSGDFTPLAVCMRERPPATELRRPKKWLLGLSWPLSAILVLVSTGALVIDPGARGVARARSR